MPGRPEPNAAELAEMSKCKSTAPPMTLAEALAGIPGWENATAHELTGGSNNQTWKLELDGRKAVLKLAATEREPWFWSRQQEAEVQQVAASLDLAPAAPFASDHVLLTDWAPGATLTRDDLLDHSLLGKIATRLRRLHALPPCGFQLDIAAAAIAYAERIVDADPKLVKHCLRVIADTEPNGELDVLP